jgi:hypothetical protein
MGTLISGMVILTHLVAVNEIGKFSLCTAVSVITLPVISGDLNFVSHESDRVSLQTGLNLTLSFGVNSVMHTWWLNGDNLKPHARAVVLCHVLDRVYTNMRVDDKLSFNIYCHAGC